MDKLISTILIVVINLMLLSADSYCQQEFDKEIKLWFEPQITKESSLLGACDDDAWLENGYGYGIGFDFAIKTKKGIWFDAGIEYLSSSNVYKYGNYYPNQELVIKSVNIYFKFIRIPFGIGLDITNWLRINSGLSIDYQYNNRKGDYISNQSGLSFYFNPAFRYNLSNGFVIAFEPKLTEFLIFSFKNEKCKERIMCYGFCIALIKRF